jgi:hypothetical protein
MPPMLRQICHQRPKQPKTAGRPCHESNSVPRADASKEVATPADTAIERPGIGLGFHPETACGRVCNSPMTPSTRRAMPEGGAAIPSKGFSPEPRTPPRAFEAVGKHNHRGRPNRETPLSRHHSTRRRRSLASLSPNSRQTFALAPRLTRCRSSASQRPCSAPVAAPCRRRRGW